MPARRRLAVPLTLATLLVLAFSARAAAAPNAVTAWNASAGKAVTGPAWLPGTTRSTRRASTP
jgi:hypothetical protein